MELLGTVELRSDQGIDVTTLRCTVTLRREFVFTTIPVANYDAGLRSVLSFPQFADGGGFSSQTLLLNPSDAAVRATLRFGSPTGLPLKVDIR